MGQLRVRILGACALSALALSCEPPEEVREQEEQALTARDGEVVDSVTNCGSELTPPVIHAEWAELPGSASVASVDSMVTLKLRNDGPERVRVHDIDVRSLGGGKATKSSVNEIELAPKEEAFLAFDIAAEGITLSKTVDVSGELAILALISPTEGEREGHVVERVVVPPLYFHQEEGGDLVVYGEQALRDQFNSGDVSGKLAPLIDKNPASARRVAVWAPELEDAQ